MLKYFDRYMLREAAAPFGIGLLVYSFVLLMNQLLVFPELFIAQGVPLLTTLKLLGYLIPAILAFTVPMAVLMGVLAGLSRMSSDAEITACKTLGIGHLRILRPLLLFAFAGWEAVALTAGLQARICLVAVHAVPYPADFRCQQSTHAFLVDQLTALAADCPLPVNPLVVPSAGSG